MDILPWMYIGTYRTIEIKIAALLCPAQVPALALPRLYIFGKTSAMSTPLCAVLGWFLGQIGRPLVVFPDRVRIF